MAEATEPKQSEGEAVSGIVDMTKGRQEMVEPKWSEGETALGIAKNNLIFDFLLNLVKNIKMTKLN